MGLTDSHSIKSSGLEADLHLLHTMWEAARTCGPDLRPSDRHTIRQGMDASLRLGENLVQQSAVCGAIACRTFPRNTITTRIRTFPRAMRLDFPMPCADTGNETSIFLTLSAETVTIGLNAPAFNTENDRKAKMQEFRAHAPEVFKDLRQAQAKSTNAETDERPAVWHLSATEPTIHQDQCGSDLNNWLKVRSSAAAKTMGAFTISMTISEAAPSAEKLIDLLETATDIFQPFFNTVHLSNGQPDTTEGANPPQ